MEIKEFHELINTVFPSAFWEWPKGKAPKPPYITYFEPNAVNFSADNKVYYSGHRIAVELITLTRDIEAERAVEALFDANDFYWDKEVTHLDDEDCFEAIYYLEVK